MRSNRPNILIFMSDEHKADAGGFGGSSVVKTPSLDKLAACGFVFDNAYCNSPMCVPSRMSFLSGRYPFQVQVYDNGSPLASEIPSYSHYLEASGYETVMCGRMHMVGPDRTHGFGRRLYDDVSLWQSFRQTPKRSPDVSRGSNSHVTDRGPGYGSWQDYDITTTDLAERYIRSKTPAGDSDRGIGKTWDRTDKPWMMTVGVMFPHFPHIPPKEFYELYENLDMDPELSPTRHERPEAQHPAIRELRRFFCNSEPVSDEIARESLASYYACTSFMDDCFGKLMRALEETGQLEDTVVIYTSDHGEMAGAHGIWQKQCFYEEAIRIPMIMRLPRNHFTEHGQAGRIDAPVSLVDLFPTILDLSHCRPVDRMPGRSLLSMIPSTTNTGVTDLKSTAERIIFSEYQAQGSLSGFFMVKRGNWKYNYYVDHEPELFDLEEDPHELHNLAGEESTRAVRAEFHAALIEIMDSPEEVDRMAKANQQKQGLDRLDRRGLILHDHLRKV